MSTLNQNLLTLDFWQDKVTYGKQTVPIGTIGCAALNITDEHIAELTMLCQPLTEIILMLGTGDVDVSVFPKAEESLLQIVRFLQNTEPFSFLPCTACRMPSSIPNIKKSSSPSGPKDSVHD